MMLLILFIIIIITLITTYSVYGGSKYIILKNNISDDFITPQWCPYIDSKFSIELPIYPQKKLDEFYSNYIKYFIHNTQRRKFLISNEYGSFYTAANFILNNKHYKDDIIMFVPQYSIVPHLLSTLFKRKIMYYAPIKSKGNAKWLGKIPTNKHFNQYKNCMLISSAIWYTSRDANDVYNNSLFSWLFIEHILRSFVPVAWSVLAVAHKNAKVNIPIGTMNLVPFYYPGSTPFFEIYQNHTQNYYVQFTPKDLTPIYNTLQIFNMCARNISYNNITNIGWDLTYANIVMDQFDIKSRRIIIDILGELPQVVAHKSGNVDIINNESNVIDSFIFGSYHDYTDFIQFETQDYFNPPLLIYGNIVQEYGLKTVLRGLVQLSWKYTIVFFNCMRWFDYFVSLGQHYMTSIPHILEDRHNIVKVVDIDDMLKIVQNEANVLIIDEYLECDELFNYCQKALVEKNIDMTMWTNIYTDDIPFIRKLLAKTYNIPIIYEDMPTNDRTLYWNNI